MILMGLAFLSSLPLDIGAARSQAEPDPTVSMNVVPNPVSIGKGYEVRVTNSNIKPIPTIVRPGPPHAPVPTEGADVQQVDLVLGSTVASGRVAMQAEQPLSVSNCVALDVGSAE